jgi:PadR family transcriptional regulator, regulatory protein PadR
MNATPDTEAPEGGTATSDQPAAEQATSAEPTAGQPAAEQPAAEQAAASATPRLTGDMLATSLLAFLRVSNAYGYHLVQQLAEANLPAFDSGTVYRTLRQLEKGGFVSSFWDTSESGPARRIYQLTGPGQLFLSTWIDALEHHQAVLRRAMEAVEGEDATRTAAPPATPVESQSAADAR